MRLEAMALSYTTAVEISVGRHSEKMLRKSLLSLLAAAAILCTYLVAEPLWLRHWTRSRVLLLTSDDRSQFSVAFGDLAYDPDPRVSFVLLDELGQDPPLERYYQIVRVLYSRMGVQYAPEDVRLPDVATLRKLVKERYAGQAPAARKP